MTHGAGKDPYGYYGVYGSLAYDFRPVGNERPGTYSGKAARKRKIKIKRRAGISPALVVSALLCLAMVIVALMCRNDLIIISEEAHQLSEEIAALAQEQKRLKIEHAMAFSPAETERYAIEELGMRKPAAHQLFYIDVPEPVSVDEPEAEAPAGDILSRVRAYFPG